MATPKFNVNVFKVKGSGSFPIDMLRYDSCSPVSSMDASELEDSVKHNRTVALRRFYPVGGEKNPTAGRWHSFGWEVVG